LVYGDIPAFLASNKIEEQHSLPYSHYQNLVERSVQTLIQDQLLLGASFWNYALFHVIMTKNNSPNSKTDGLSPQNMVTRNIKPVNLDRTFLFAFGTPVATSLDKIERTWKFDVRNDLGIFVGHVEGSVGGGLVYFPSNGLIAPRSNLIQIKITEKEFNKFSLARTMFTGNTTRREEQLKLFHPQDIKQPDFIHNKGTKQVHPQVISNLTSIIMKG